MAGEIYEGFSVSHAQVLDGATPFLTAIQAAATEAQDVYGVNDGSVDVDDDSFDNEGDDSVLSVWAWINGADVAIQGGYLSFPLLSTISGRPIDNIAGAAAVNEVQNQTALVGATGGTYKLTYNGQTTSALAYNAVAATVQTALEALSNVGTGDIVVSGGPLSTTPVVYTFANDKAGSFQPQMTADLSTVTGPGAITGGVMSTSVQGKPITPTSTAIDLWHDDSNNQPPKPCILVMPSKDKLGNAGRLIVGLYRLTFKPISFDGPQYKDGLKVNWNARANRSLVDETGSAFPDGKGRLGRALWIPGA